MFVIVSKLHFFDRFLFMYQTVYWERTHVCNESLLFHTELYYQKYINREFVIKKKPNETKYKIGCQKFEIRI